MGASRLSPLRRGNQNKKETQIEIPLSTELDVKKKQHPRSTISFADRGALHSPSHALSLEQATLHSSMHCARPSLHLITPTNPPQTNPPLRRSILTSCCHGIIIACRETRLGRGQPASFNDRPSDRP
jgi:hypothetical protein